MLSPVPLLPRALRNRSDHIDIPSTQHRSSKGSRTTHQSTKARSENGFLFEECITAWISSRQPVNFGSNSGFSLGDIGKELECNNIDSYRRKGSLLIQTLYLWDRDRGRGKKPKISHSTFFWSKNQSDWFRTLRSMRKWVRFYRINKPMGLKEWWKGIKRKERERKSKWNKE